MQPQVQIQYQYVDRADVSETYVDLLEKGAVDNAIVKLEFCVTRMNDPHPPKPPTGRKITACRLAIPIPGLLQMLGQLNGLVAALEQQGVIKKMQIAPASTSGQPN